MDMNNTDKPGVDGQVFNLKLDKLWFNYADVLLWGSPSNPFPERWNGSILLLLSARRFLTDKFGYAKDLIFTFTDDQTINTARKIYYLIN